MSISLNSFSDLIKSFQYNNIVKNPTFESTSGWAIVGNSGTISAESNTLKITANGNYSYAIVYQGHDMSQIQQNYKFYQVADMRVTNPDCSRIDLYIYDGLSYTKTQNTPIQNEWYKLSQIVTITNASPTLFRTYFRHVYSDAGTATGKVMEVKNSMLINLTSLFGQGNEPSLNDCNDIFKFVDGNTQPNFSKQIAI